MANIINPGGSDFDKWQPPGMVTPRQTPRDVIALSPSLAHLTKIGAGKKQQDVWRCPICGTPYASQVDMEVCAQQPVDRTVQSSLGVDIGDAVKFLYMPRKLEDLVFAGRVREQDIVDRDMPEFTGTLRKWIQVRSPRGHEPLPVVRWIHPGKPGSQKGMHLESWLLPKPPHAVMMATPSRTRDLKKNRNEF